MGAPGRNFAHMRDLYPQQIARGGHSGCVADRPVALETCWVPEQWHQWNFPLKPILDQALRWHASTINIKSSRIPADWKAAFDEFQKQIGYRFVLKRLEYPSKVTRGAMAAVQHVVVQRRCRARLWQVHTRARDRRQGHAARHRNPAMAAGRCGRTTTRSPCLASSRQAGIPVRVRCSTRLTQRPAIQLAIAGRQTMGGIRSVS